MGNRCGKAVGAAAAGAMVKGRFAPSPTGRMHLGNVYCALLSWLSARRQGGGWLLRIEDLDRGRSRDEYARMIMDDLRWLGLEWDEGPYYQSGRDEVYGHYFGLLDTYPCFCSRADLLAASAPHASDGRRVYAGTCRDMDAARRVKLGKVRPPAWRVRVPQQEVRFRDLHYGQQAIDLATEWGDFVVRRTDGTFAYQLAVCVDDALMGVTEVVRGVDLLSSVAPQMFLYDRLGLETPCFGHVPLICNTMGQRLCKRDKSLDMGEIRKRHNSPHRVLGALACYAGLLAEPDEVDAEELVPLFSWDKIPLDDVPVDGFRF